MPLAAALPTTDYAPVGHARSSLGPLRLGTLTVLLLGLQFTWAVELAYGNPYLLSLGMDKALTSLVWLAGPISGLLTQPIVGALSDKCTSRFGRRRPFIVGGATAVALSLLLIAYSRELGASPPSGPATTATLGLAVFGFYIMDFAINTVQGSARAIIIDVAPQHQQAAANAYASVMICLGNILGYATGFLDLPRLFGVHGESAQLKLLCAVAVTVFFACVVITCACTHERTITPRPAAAGPLVLDRELTGSVSILPLIVRPFRDIFRAMRKLPRAVRQICFIQFFAWLGWFPFLFYSTTYVAQYEVNSRRPFDGPDKDHATRFGSLAVLYYSIVSFVVSMVVPVLADRFSLSMRSMWLSCELVFAALMASTFLVRDGQGATSMIAVCGYSWALGTWLPMALIGKVVLNGGQFVPMATSSPPATPECEPTDLPVSPAETQVSMGGIDDDDRDCHLRTPGPAETSSPRSSHHRISATSSPKKSSYDDTKETRTAGYRTRTTTESTTASSRAAAVGRPDMPSAGVILGIHNCFIVLPQLVVSLLGAVLFALLPDDDGPVRAGTRSDAIGWLFRIGGITALVAAVLIARLPRV